MADDKPKADEPMFSNPFAAPDPDPVPMPEPEEPAAPSMAMTKAELLDRLREHDEGLTKAEILERLEGKSDDADDDAPTAGAVPLSTETRSARIDGIVYTWTEASQDTVPEEARLIYARAKAAGGAGGV